MVEKMVEKRRYFTFDVLIFRDGAAYSVKTEYVVPFNKIKVLMNEKHIPIDCESEVLDEDKKQLKQLIGIRKRSDVKKLINVLINESWCYLHIDLN